jgi:hypothetical protein
MLEGVARSPASLKKFEAMGDGCTTTTSMPELRSSAATDVANSVKNDLVDAYSEDRGLGTNPATRTAGVRNLSIARTQHCLSVKESTLEKDALKYNQIHKSATHKKNCQWLLRVSSRKK